MSVLVGAGTPRAHAGSQKLPRVGFVGTGDLLASLRQSGLVEIAGVAGGSAPPRETRRNSYNVHSLEQLMNLELEGLVIAEAGPADHALAGLEHGLAVFCPSPVGWSLEAARQAARAARERNCLLAVDFPYRRLTGAEQIRELLRQKELGTVFSADLVFHAPQRPTQSWFGNTVGEGCATGLGLHLVDLALWCLDYPQVIDVASQLLAQGRPIRQEEDFATVRLTLHTGASIQISCSWKLPSRYGAVISGTFCGTKGTAQFRNIGGSLTRFGAWHLKAGAKRKPLLEQPRPRRAAAALEWARRLAQNNSYDPAIEELTAAAATVERMRGKNESPQLCGNELEGHTPASCSGRCSVNGSSDFMA